jgi:hypothetical protein
MAEAITEMIIPGTYIEVRAEGLIGVSGIATGNVGVVGTASKGPIGTPVVLSSFSDAREVFGDYDPWSGGTANELTLVRALQQVFSNGGSTVYAVRVANAAQAASRDLLGASKKVGTLKAKTPGTWGDAITAQVKDASANAFVEANAHTVVDPKKLEPLHAGIVAGSPRNLVRVTRHATKQTFTRKLVAGAAASGAVGVNDKGELAFMKDDEPVAGDEVVASYEVAKTAAKDVVIVYANAKETYTVADVQDLAADVAASSTLVDVADVALGSDLLAVSDVASLQGGSDGTSGADYGVGLAQLDNDPINLVVLAGQSVTAASDVLLGSVEFAENNGHERLAIVGTDSGDSAIALGNAATVADDRLILVTPGIIARDIASGSPASLPPAYAAAAVAGLIAGLAVQVSPTNKTLAVSGLTTLYNDGQLKQLLGNRLLCLQRKSGFRVVKGITTDDAAFRQISVRRIVDYAKQGTRIGTLPYIGRLNNSRVRGAMQATLNGFLADMVLNEALTEFTLTVTATRAQEVNGVAVVTMMLKPTFSIDYIKVIMNLS